MAPQPSLDFHNLGTVEGYGCLCRTFPPLGAVWQLLRIRVRSPTCGTESSHTAVSSLLPVLQAAHALDLPRCWDVDLNLLAKVVFAGRSTVKSLCPPWGSQIFPRGPLEAIQMPHPLCPPLSFLLLSLPPSLPSFLPAWSMVSYFISWVRICSSYYSDAHV